MLRVLRELIIDDNCTMHLNINTSLFVNFLVVVEWSEANGRSHENDTATANVVSPRYRNFDAGRRNSIDEEIPPRPEV